VFVGWGSRPGFPESPEGSPSRVATASSLRRTTTDHAGNHPYIFKKKHPNHSKFRSTPGQPLQLGRDPWFSFLHLGSEPADQRPPGSKIVIQKLKKTLKTIQKLDQISNRSNAE